MPCSVLLTVLELREEFWLRNKKKFLSIAVMRLFAKDLECYSARFA